MGSCDGVHALTTREDIQAHKSQGSWRDLERLAVEIVADASTRAKSEFKPVLGGGTRLMLALDHRISDDIDFFIRDPQWIGYLSPRLNDKFDSLINGYDEGASSLKLKLPYGEIDFIVSMSLLGLPNETSDECAFELEPVAEVLAKKLFYRGWALTPRDLFDWQAIESKLPPKEIHAQEIAELLSGRIEQLQAALIAMEYSEHAHHVWAQIRAPSLPDLHESVQWAHHRLRAFHEISHR